MSIDRLMFVSAPVSEISPIETSRIESPSAGKKAAASYEAIDSPRKFLCTKVRARGQLLLETIHSRVPSRYRPGSVARRRASIGRRPGDRGILAGEPERTSRWS